ncbi:bestrophin family protein [Dyadobacter sp. CY312]|uniref:bestrophin family protein n=1 Tax=Dyadobacter sp. CY312 TaxID=2907303 RepID=UPI001F28965F|nr:bestrophin family ion channel [Dyadobacter sp. CY312]MCE7042784.1 multidrug transporter [Dyadobacter sp. CY312]
MNISSHYKLGVFLVWTRRSIYALVLLAAVPTALYQVLGWKWIAIPWVPIALVGTAASFIAGFKNTQTYNRTWEARQIWGAIINSSRAWGIMARDFVAGVAEEEEQILHRQLVYRHFAWLTALRFQMRDPRSWEHIRTKPYNVEFKKYYRVPEWESDLGEELEPYLTEKECSAVLKAKNRATQIIALQSAQLKALKQSGQLETFPYMQMANLLKELYEHQGKSERIKNFPYPRQFASINLFFIRLLVILMPFGMLNEFAKLGDHGVWLTIPFSVIVGWVFTSLEQVGESTENPFEGGANDVPITSMCRTIESDLREILGESDLPPAIVAENDILM